MSDELDQLLSGLAGTVSGAARTPDPAAVRKRGAQRTVRRRMAVSAFCVTALVGGATATALTVTVHGGKGTPLPAVNSGNSTPIGTATPVFVAPTPGASASTLPPNSIPTVPTTASSTPDSNTTPNSVQVAPGSVLTGVWKPTNGSGQELIVYPDGVVGMGAAGSWAFCAGTAQSSSDGSFPLIFPSDGCITYIDTGFSASSNASHSILTVTTQTTSGPYTETYARAGSSPSGPASGGGHASGDFSPLAGTWSNGTAGETFTVSASGAVTWTRLGQQGQTTSGSGSAQLLADGTFRITTNFGSPSESGLWQVSVASGGQSITVIGSYGPDTFTRTSP